MRASNRQRIFGVFVALLMTLAAAPAQAAPPDRPIRIGILTSTTEERAVKLERSLVDGLRAQGYVEGRHFGIVRRTGRYPDLDPYAKELADLNLDTIVTSCGYSTSLAVKAIQSTQSNQLTQLTPIVMGSVVDPVGRGFVKSLARPGTNVTGNAHNAPQLAPKMIEYLHSRSRTRVGSRR